MSLNGGRDRLIVALDADPETVLRMALELKGHVGWMKVGMTLFYQAGPQIVSDVLAMGYRVFLDLKIHDIPHQARGAARAVAGLGAQMLTVHAWGGSEMIAAAVEGAGEGALEAGIPAPAILAVTVLTSLDDEALTSLGVANPSSVQVPMLARAAIEAGAGGIVCSPLEAGAVREAIGSGPLIVTPGVRPAGVAASDQSRVATPAEAVRLGATHLVVGRPITESHDRAAAADDIVAEMEGGIL